MRFLDTSQRKVWNLVFYPVFCITWHETTKKVVIRKQDVPKYSKKVLQKNANKFSKVKLKRTPINSEDVSFFGILFEIEPTMIMPAMVAIFVTDATAPYLKAYLVEIITPF